MNFDDLDPEGAAEVEQRHAQEDVDAAIKRFTEIILEKALEDATRDFTTKLAQNIEAYFADNKATRQIDVAVRDGDIFVTIKLQEKDLKNLLFVY